MSVFITWFLLALREFTSAQRGCPQFSLLGGLHGAGDHHPDLPGGKRWERSAEVGPRGDRGDHAGGKACPSPVR